MALKDKGKSMGVRTGDIADTLRASFYGAEVMRLQRGRHEVKLMAPQFVKPYIKSNKNDMRDAEGIGVGGHTSQPPLQSELQRRPPSEALHEGQPKSQPVLHPVLQLLSQLKVESWLLVHALIVSPRLC